MLGDTQIFVAKDAELSDSAKRTLVIIDGLIKKYGLAWRNRFPNLFFVGKEDYSTILWHDEELMISLPGSYTHLDKPYYTLGRPDQNPDRVNRWTSVYLDTSNYKLMVSSITPLYVEEQFVGVFGHDIFLDELLARTIEGNPDSAINMLITDEGNLLTHPDYMDLITESENSVRITESGDDNLRTIYQLVRDAQSQQLAKPDNLWEAMPVIVEDSKYDRYLVATQLGEMGWTLITEFPRSLIAEQAFKSAKTILVLGAILIFVEFLVIFFAVRRKVSTPLKELGLAAKSWKSNRAEGLFDKFADRKDEVGSLAREFVHLQRTINDQISQLHNEIEVRKKAEQALTEHGNQLANLNENLDVMVQKRTADLEREVHERSLLTAAMEHAAETIMITDARFVIEYVNSMYEESSGYTKEELIGEKAFDSNSIRSDLSVHKEILDALHKGEMWSGRVRTESKQGLFLEEDATISPIRDESGKVTHFVEVKRNITERLKLEQQLQSAQKLESIGQLAAGIAHEINTPTQYIGDNTKFLKEAYGDLSDLINKIAELPEGEISREKVAELMQEADVEYLQEEVPQAIEQCLEGID